ncbi:MAG: MarR family transcriptional regulator [Bdellovibrionales bacterium]|nr:MarR family transcriptional regulator [Bdellovibrionales bacterium]
MLSKKLLDSIPQSIRIIRKLATESVVGTLTLNQVRVLNLISLGQGQSQIAETLDVSVAAVSKMITCLKKHKIVQSKAGEDRRIHMLSLTAKGKQTRDKISEYVCHKLDIGIAELTKEEKDQLMKGLVVLDLLMQKVKEV